jgi:molecular chaperone HscB
MDGMGFASLGTVHWYVNALTHNGHLDRSKGPNGKRALALTHEEHATPARLPLLGLIAAGEPIEALENAESISVPPPFIHPDNFVTKGDKEKSIALQNTSLINTAYDTLKSPLLRATYLLELQDINAFDEKDTQMDMDFLMNQIALREKLELLEVDKDELALDDFIEKVSQKVTQNIEQVKQLFELNEFDKIKNLVRELKFYTQLKVQANQLMEEWL